MLKPSNKLYGLLHDADGTPRIQEPRSLKVGIGLPKGKAMHVWIDGNGKWCVAVGKEVSKFESKDEARKHYNAAKANAPERKNPQRLPHFTFATVSKDGSFEPDFDAIEEHGPMPTEVDIVFLKDESFKASYQLWTATEKKCEGDGINALRVFSMAETPDEKGLVAEAQRKGERYFPIINGCWTKGCPYAQPTEDGHPSPCRPSGRMVFQLLNSPRLGATAYFDTRGRRSISQIFSCLETFKSMTGGGNPERGYVAGIPLKMVVRPYRSKYRAPDGTEKTTNQYGVSLEFRAAEFHRGRALALKDAIIEYGTQFRAAGSHLQLPAAELEAPEPEEIPAAITAEFTGSDDGGEPDDSQPNGDPPPVDDNGDEEDFSEVFQPEPKKAQAMPRRKSEAQGSQAQPAAPQAPPQPEAGQSKLNIPAPICDECGADLKYHPAGKSSDGKRAWGAVWRCAKYQWNNQTRRSNGHSRLDAAEWERCIVAGTGANRATATVGREPGSDDR